MNMYDGQNRLTQAKGKYGVENYTYADNGNLTRRGNFTLTYGNANHKHAVTSVTSPNTGVLDYSYDAAGNMEKRVDDLMSYNGQGKLKRIVTGGGDILEYLYDSSGNRIRKKSKNSEIIAYNFDGLYEITKTPREGTTHTLYFKGLYGDIFAQMTRSDADLVSDLTPNPPFLSRLIGVVPSPERRGESFSFGFCNEVAGSCSQYYLNTVKFYWIKGIVEGYTVISSVEYDIAVWMLLLYGIFVVYGRDVACNVSTNWHAKRTLFATPLLIVSILFTFTQCGVIGGDKSKNAPWMLLASGINSNTASVDTDGYTPYGGNGASYGGGNSSLAPVTGMYFLHPDHLGSITMITDGNGNVVTGKDSEGKSHISYKPYGEILRTDSGGPDISKFKFTGQEEDKESGLMYYKARYYDPVIGRFLQADSVIMPESTFGMNRYMYVDGNPVKFRDASGHNKTKNFFSNLGSNMMGGAEWAAKGMIGGAELASKPIRNSGLKQAADTFNKVTSQDYEKRSRVDHGKAIAAGFAIGAVIGAYTIGGTFMTNYIGSSMAVHGIIGGMTGATITMLYELGTRGHFDNWGLGNETISFFANILVLAGATGGFKVVADGVTSPEYGLLLSGIGLGAAVREGDRVYQSNMDRRKGISGIGCLMTAKTIANEKIDVFFGGSVFCLLEALSD
ncbi:MAG: RHS repeat-associated core domain-containing protein [Leptospiraceae bacterium]|nr:RHS repeat-associated core domain-containing protein [Leptospiraceae bacterium]